jgi:hypothetical protein
MPDLPSDLLSPVGIVQNAWPTFSCVCSRTFG